MRDTEHLTDAEKKIDHLMAGMNDQQLYDLAKLGLLLHVIHADHMSPAARDTFDNVLRDIGPDFLLTFRALRQAARHIIRNRRNWRSRT